MALFSEAGWLFLLRWIHFLAGITWIGLLYYFNLVQTPFFAETDASVRSGAVQKLVPRALWWFRWGAMVTFLSGWLIILHRVPQVGFIGPYSWAILVGGLLGSIMWANVWFVIWPNQQIVIQNAVDTAAGKPANPAAAAAGARAGLASRTNVVFSIPMLFYMGAASHWPPTRITHPTEYWVALLVVLGLVELNALKATKGITTKPIETIPGVITTGFVLWAVVYALVKFVLSA